MNKIKKAICVTLCAWLSLGFPAASFSELAKDYFDRAAQYYLKGNLDAAKTQLNNAQQIDPDYQPSQKLMVLIKEKLGLGVKGDTLISLDFKETDIGMVLQALSQSYGLNIIAGDDIKGKVTVSFRDVTLEQALDNVLNVNGFTYERSNNILLVRTLKGEKATALLPLKYASADAVKGMLAKMLSSDGAIEINKESNALIVTDLTQNIKQIKALIKEMDTAPIQISIEAKLVDMQSSDLRALGVKFSADYTDTAIFHHRSSSDTTAEEIKGAFDLAEQSDLDGGQFVLNTFSIKHWVADATIDALISKQKAHLLASPSITTLNNNQARIIIGQKVPYREETQTPVGTTETTRFIDVGTTLSVTPRVNDDGYITMTIHPEVSSVVSLETAGPLITTREADTIVRVRDGETVVIGGLIKNENNGRRDRIPVLGSLPLVGFLFSNKSEDKKQTELAVFITPHIIRPDQKAALETKFEPVSAELLYNKAENFLDRLGVETWDKDKKEILNQAIALFEQLVITYPDSDKADDALYRAGMLYYHQKIVRDLIKAKTKFKLLIERYPNSEYAACAANILKKIEPKAKAATKR